MLRLRILNLGLSIVVTKLPMATKSRIANDDMGAGTTSEKELVTVSFTSLIHQLSEVPNCHACNQ